MKKLNKSKDKSKLVKMEFCYEGEEPEEDKDYAEHHIYVISGEIVPLLKKATELSINATEAGLKTAMSLLKDL